MKNYRVRLALKDIYETTIQAEDYEHAVKTAYLISVAGFGGIVDVTETIDVEEVTDEDN